MADNASIVTALRTKINTDFPFMQGLIDNELHAAIVDGEHKYTNAKTPEFIYTGLTVFNMETLLRAKGIQTDTELGDEFSRTVDAFVTLCNLNGFEAVRKNMLLVAVAVNY